VAERSAEEKSGVRAHILDSTLSLLRLLQERQELTETWLSLCLLGEHTQLIGGSRDSMRGILERGGIDVELRQLSSRRTRQLRHRDNVIDDRLGLHAVRELRGPPYGYR